MRDSYMLYKDKLGKEYRTVFDQIEMFALSQNVDNAMLEERLGELLDIFIVSQEAGKSVSQITGNNIEQFCKTFCSDFNMKNRILHILDWFKSISKVLVFVSLLDLVFALLDAADGSDFDLLTCVSSVNMTGYLIGILISGIFAMITNAVLCRIMFRTKRISMKLLRAASCVGAILSFAVIFMLLGMDSIDLFHVPIWVMLTLSCFYLLFYHLLYGRKIKRQKLKFSDLVREEIRKDMSEEMAKKYDKARKRSLKKGKGELTFEAFLDKEEKECIKTEKLKWLYYLFPLILIIIFTAVTYLEEGFDSVPDAVFFVSILAAIEYPLMLGMWKLIHTGYAARLAWISEQRNENKNEML